jgi:ketosteroid isomerase-like protein
MMLDTTEIEDWLARYRDAWGTDEREGIAGLFTDDVRYFTAPYRAPLRGREAVVAFWLGEREWDMPWTFEYEVLARQGGLHVVRAVTTYPDGTRDAGGREVFFNLWLVTLDGRGRAREFVEYFMLEEKDE